MRYLDSPVLGIETSCDETSAAVVIGRKVMANLVSSQASLHQKWGGVVPEAAARRHVETLLPAIEEALSVAGIDASDLGGIGVTNRPGLIGALSTGVSAAKALAFVLDIPFVGVHHLEGHLLSPLLTKDLSFPQVCLLVSGGHTEIVLVLEPGNYTKLGGTLDDAAGECFDKCARTLGLGYPGGPAIQESASLGDTSKYKLPKGLSGRTYDFSFSGLKTAVAYLVRDEAADLDVPGASASFEDTITSVLAERAIAACLDNNVGVLTVAGGVAANRRLRERLQLECAKREIEFAPAASAYCTDNAAMIAHVASWRLARGETDDASLEVTSVAELPKEKI